MGYVGRQPSEAILTNDDIADGTVTKDKVSLISNGTAGVTVKGDGGSNDAYIAMNCRDNSHAIKLKAPPHSAGQSYTLTFPSTSPSAGKVLQTDGSGNLSWVSQPTGGVDMHDVWTISSAFNASGDITANLIRANAYAGTIGSAMTESSGIFTFPSTGIYKVVFHIMWRVASGSATRYLSANTYKTTDNSNYTLGANTAGSVNPANSNSTYQQTTANFFFAFFLSVSNKEAAR
jgi:hypothetical protein